MEVYSSTGKINTVTYFTKGRRLKFIVYNKLIEMEDKRREIPAQYKGTNVIRLEYAIEKEAVINKIFGKTLKAYDLATINIYHTLQKMFFSFYMNISKTGQNVFINPVGIEKLTKPQFNKIVLEQFRQLFSSNYDFLLQDAQALGLLTKNTMTSIRVENKTDSANYNISHTNELITELNEKIELVMRSR
jgi:chaperonin GroEL (HSP60 family)